MDRYIQASFCIYMYSVHNYVPKGRTYEGGVADKDDLNDLFTAIKAHCLISCYE